MFMLQASRLDFLSALEARLALDIQDLLAKKETMLDLYGHGVLIILDMEAVTLKVYQPKIDTQQ